MGKEAFDIQEESDGRVNILVLSGPVDSQTYDAFKSVLHKACAAQGAHVLLDCKGLTYMNSKSFGLLAQHHRKLLQGMGRLAVCSVNRRLVKTMDLLGLGQMLRIYDTREEALAELE